MPKLYHEQAWVVPGQQGRGAERVDVPNSPAELAAWLNERRVSPVPYDKQRRRDLVMPFDDDEEISSPGAQLISDRPQSEVDEFPDGAIVSAAEARSVNAARPTFLPRVSPDEIARQRLAVDQCPKCGKRRRTLLSFALGNDLDAFAEWLDSRDLGDLWAIQRAGELLRDRVRALRGDEEGGLVQ